MINTLNQSAELPRLTKTRFLSILTITALVLTATLSHADSDANQSESNGLAGTWISIEFAGTKTFL